jgi:steroid delta-isomerase-like uncharacterized protein
LLNKRKSEFADFRTIPKTLSGEIQMSIEENKAIARRFFEEVWNNGNLAVADELLAPNIIFHLPGEPEEVIGDRESYKQVVRRNRTAFPDLQEEIEDMIAEGDRVVTRWLWRGTHQGEWHGHAPTGKTFTYGGITILRIADGKIVEDWFYSDLLGLQQQLGTLPAQA